MADSGEPIEFLAADLAPGDSRALEMDRAGLDVTRVQSPHDPVFEMAYARLWAEFGAQNEMETRQVIAERLAWLPAKARGDYRLRYEMLLARRHGEFVAVRDHTAITTHSPRPQAVVHLSHVLVDPALRRTGLAGWLRGWPIQTARACLAAAGMPIDSPITLVAEMEHPDENCASRMTRLKAYEKSGFTKMDPAMIHYFQPDFRPPSEIDAHGGPKPLPFALILRRVGREREQSISGCEVLAIVESLYQMYSEGFRDSDMVAARRLFRHPGPDAQVRLVPPSQ